MKKALGATLVAAILVAAFPMTASAAEGTSRTSCKVFFHCQAPKPPTPTGKNPNGTSNGGGSSTRGTSNGGGHGSPLPPVGAGR